MSIAHPLLDPWVITGEGKAKVLDIYNRAHALGLAARVADRMARAEAGEVFTCYRNAEMVGGGVAVVTIDGPLMRKAELFSDISGATSYQWIGERCDEITEAANAGQVRNAVFVFNTPGGEAAGCGVCGDKIRKLAALLESLGGELVGYAETQAASGGQWLLSQCSRKVAHRQAFLGSFGVRSMIVDDSARDEKAGVKEIEIVADGSPEKRATPVDDKVIARVQTLSNDIFDVFAQAMADGYGVTVAEAVANFGRGAQLIADKALAAGLIDEIADFDSVLAELQAGASTPTTRPTIAAPRSTSMSIKQPVNGTVTPAPTVEDGGGEWKCKGCDQPMGASADKFCAHCMDGDDKEEDGDDEDSKALAAAGLLGKTRGQTREKLAAFALSVLEATNTKTAAAAIPRVIAGAKAETDMKTSAEAAEKKAAELRTKALGDKLAAGIATGKLPLGVIAKEIPLLSGAPKAAIKAKLAAVTTQDAASIIAAITTAAPVTEDFAASVDEWLESKGASALPSAHRQASEADPAAISASTPPAIALPGTGVVGSPLSIDSVLKAAEKPAK